MPLTDSPIGTRPRGNLPAPYAASNTAKPLEDRLLSENQFLGHLLQERTHACQELEQQVVELEQQLQGNQHLLKGLEAAVQDQDRWQEREQALEAALAGLHAQAQGCEQQAAQGRARCRELESELKDARAAKAKEQQLAHRLGQMYDQQMKDMQQQAAAKLAGVQQVQQAAVQRSQSMWAAFKVATRAEVQAAEQALQKQACSQERVLEQMSKRCGLLESRLESLAPAVQQAGQLREANKVLRAQLQAAIARADTAELQLAALAPSRVGELRQLQHDVQDVLNNLRVKLAYSENELGSLQRQLDSAEAEAASKSQRCQLLRDELMSLTTQLQETSERGAVQAAQHAHVLKQLAAAEADNMHQRAELAEARAEASSARACTVEGLLAAARAEAATSHTVGHSTSHHRAHHSQATPSSTPKTLKLSYGIHPDDAYGSTAIASAGHGYGTAGTCTYTNGSDIGGRRDGQRHAGLDSGDGGGGIPLYRMLLEAAVAAGLEREDGLRRAAEEAVEMEMRARMVAAEARDAQAASQAALLHQVRRVQVPETLRLQDAQEIQQLERHLHAAHDNSGPAPATAARAATAPASHHLIRDQGPEPACPVPNALMTAPLQGIMRPAARSESCISSAAVGASSLHSWGKHAGDSHWHQAGTGTWAPRLASHDVSGREQLPAAAMAGQFDGEPAGLVQYTQAVASSSGSLLHASNGDRRDGLAERGFSDLGSKVPGSVAWGSCQGSDVRKTLATAAAAAATAVGADADACQPAVHAHPASGRGADALPWGMQVARAALL